jgi:hypothetical protein
MLAGIDPHVHVFAPLDDDLLAHLDRVAGFDRRAEDPTAWTIELRAGDDWLERFEAERPGDIVVISGRNRRKIDLIERAVAAGKHVLADKPWIIEPEALPRVAAVLEAASRAGLVLSDAMTERHEITSILLRDIVNDRELFGEIAPGTAEKPGVFMRSVHHLKKPVAGVPLRRPAWFFDIREQGSALADVGTHLVDLVNWTLASGRAIDVSKDLRLIDADCGPTILQRSQFAAITGLADYPPELRGWVVEDQLAYYCNNSIAYELNGVRIRLCADWNVEAPPGGGDSHMALFFGSRCIASVSNAPGGPTDVDVSPRRDAKDGFRTRIERRVAAWQERYPGVALDCEDGGCRIVIPPAYRTDHESHFAEVAGEVVKRIVERQPLTPIEASHMLAKYFVTTFGVALARSLTA